MLVIHDEHLIQRLKAKAAAEQRSIEDVLISLLDSQVATNQPDLAEDPQRGTGKWLASHLDELSFDTPNSIDPTQADEILRTEYADYLWKRFNDDGADSDTRR